MLVVIRQHRSDDLDVFTNMLFKKWSDATVNQTRSQDRLIGRSALTLDKTASFYLARGVKTLLVIDHQRQKVDARALALGHDRGPEDDRVAQSDGASPVGLR